MLDLENMSREHLWYLVGLIATDGCLSKDGRHIVITSKDIDFLEYIKNVLGLKNKIGMKARGGEKEKKYGMLSLGDVNFYRYLLSIG